MGGTGYTQAGTGKTYTQMTTQNVTGGSAAQLRDQQCACCAATHISLDQHPLSFVGQLRQLLPFASV